MSTYQQEAVLFTTIVRAKPLQLTVDIEIQERAVCGRRNIVIQVPIVVRNSTSLAIIRISFDISSLRDIEDVDVTIHGKALILPMAEATVAGQNKELAVGQRVELRLGGHFRVLACLRGVVFVEGQWDYVLGEIYWMELV